MLQTNSGKVFKNNFKNFLRYFKTINNQKTTTNKISVDLSIDSNSIKDYNLKYLKLISINHYSNSIDYDINQNVFGNDNLYNNTSSLESQLSNIDIKTSTYKVTGLKTIQKNLSSLLGSIDSLSNKNIKPNMKSFENIYEFKEIQELYTLFFNLEYNNNESSNNKNIYDLIIYAYDSKDKIIDRFELLNQNILSYTETDLTKKNKLIEYTNINNMFEIHYNEYLNDNQNRTINLLLNPDIEKLINEFELNNSNKMIKNIEILEIYNKKIIDQKRIEYDNKNKNIELTFNKKIEVLGDNDKNIEYRIIITDYLSRIWTYVKSINNIKITSFQNIIRNSIKDIFLNYIAYENVFKCEISLYNLLINKNLYLKSLEISGIELINNCYVNDQKIEKIDFENNNLYTIFSGNDSIKFYILDTDFSKNIENLIVNNENLKISFYDKKEKKNVLFYKKIFLDYFETTNQKSLNITNSDLDNYIKVKNDMTMYNINYNLSLNNFDNFKRLSIESDNLLSLNYQTFLDEDSKNLFFQQINQIFNFYVVFKKNIITNNQFVEKFEIAKVSINLENIDVSFEDNKIKDSILDQNLLYKKIFFESKVFVIPNNLFNSNVYEIKKRIKSIINTNNNILINNDEEINQIYRILKKINDKNIQNIDDFDMSYLYNLFSINNTYARSNIKIFENSDFLSNKINLNKKVYIENNKINNFLNKNYLEFDILINVEELNRSNVKSNAIISFFNDLVRKKKVSFDKFYNKTNNEISKFDMYDLFLSTKKIISYEEYIEIYSEMNNNFIMTYSFISKDQVKLNFKVDRSKCVKLNNFIHLIKSNGITGLNLANLYQKINFSSDVLSYFDDNNNEVNISISFESSYVYHDFEIFV